MAALIITPAAVLPSAGADYVRGTAGVTITAGQSVYLDSATNTIKLADNNATALTAAGVGIAAHAALAGQPILYYVKGRVLFGAILTAGVNYFVGPGAGEIIPETDLASPMWVSRLGQAQSTTELLMDVLATGVVHG